MTPFAFFLIFMTALGFLCGWELNETFHKKEKIRKKEIEEAYQKKVINARYGKGGWTC